MRIGNNPEKKNNLLEIESYHRVVIPVYIPNLTEDYFKDGLKILKLCIQSLLLTSHSKTKITLINNGSCNEVALYLKEQFDINGKIDQFFNSKINLGKVNAIYSAVKSNLESLITIADADVLFLPNWQNEVELVMQNFPEAGMVSPVPSIGSLKGSFIRSTVGFSYFKGKIKYEKVKNIEGIRNFQKSIGKESVLNEHDTKYYTITRSNNKAVLGCGHFMVTVRASMFKYSPNEPSRFKIVGGSENIYFDKPNDRNGFIKLSTLDNYGYHLGNTYESWMCKTLDKIKLERGNAYCNDFDFTFVKPNRMYYYLGVIFQKIFIKR